MGPRRLWTAFGHALEHSRRPATRTTSRPRCTNPPGGNQTTLGTSCRVRLLSVTIGTLPGQHHARRRAAPWITYNCTQPVNSSGFNDPSLCHADLGTVWPYLHTTCTTVPIGPPAAPVDPATCLADSVAAGPGFEVTHCVRHDLPPPDPFWSAPRRRRPRS